MHAHVTQIPDRDANHRGASAARTPLDEPLAILRLRASLARSGAWSAALLVALTVAWLVVLLIAPAPPDGADAAAQLRFWENHEGWLIASFVFTVPVSLVHLPVWLALAARFLARRPLAAFLAVAFGVLYAPFPLWAYWSQITTVRGVIDLHHDAPAEATAAYQVLGFATGNWSIAYGASVLGYALWGCAALATARGLMSLPDRLATWTAIMFGTSAMFAIAGAVGFVAQVPALEIGVLLSGVVFLPALILASVLMARDGDQS